MEKVNNTEKKSRFHKLMESEFFYHYRRNASAIIGSIIILLAILIAVFGRGLAPQNPYDLTQLDIANGYLPPMWMEGGSAQFPLGTDVQGRCILSSIIYGSASSLVIGVVGMLLSCILGTTLGLISGYSDGFLGNLIMRIADVQLSFPSMFIALVVLAIMGQGVDKLLIALVLCGWVTYARTVRGVTLSVKKMDYISACKTIGLPKFLIVLRHVMPNVITSVVVLATIQTGNFILTEATLSFLGVGVPVTQPSLGLLVKNGFDVLFSGLWWASVLPGLYIMLLVFGINLLGDFLRDELNPRMK